METKSIFASVPPEIRQHLVDSFERIQHNLLAARYEPSELNGGKFCEAVLRLLQWYRAKDGSYTPFGKHIRNFARATMAFEPDDSLPDSVRFHIPRLMIFLFSIRNKRGVGHLGDGVDPNHMDAVIVEQSATWIMAELVRLFHETDTEAAQSIVEKLVARRVPLIWEVQGKRRVLRPDLTYKDKVLTLLYGTYPNELSESELFDWVEHSNKSVLRRDVIRKCHKDKLLEYDKRTKSLVISPLGIKYVEDNDLARSLQ